MYTFYHPYMYFYTHSTSLCVCIIISRSPIHQSVKLIKCMYNTYVVYLMVLHLRVRSSDRINYTQDLENCTYARYDIAMNEAIMVNRFVYVCNVYGTILINSAGYNFLIILIFLFKLVRMILYLFVKHQFCVEPTK